MIIVSMTEEMLENSIKKWRNISWLYDMVLFFFRILSVFYFLCVGTSLRPAAARSPKLFVAAPPSLLASGSVSVARRGPLAHLLLFASISLGPVPSICSCPRDIRVDGREKDHTEQEKKRRQRCKKKDGERVLRPAARLIWFSSKFDAPPSLGGTGTKSTASVRPYVCPSKCARVFHRSCSFVYPATVLGTWAAPFW